MRWRDAPGIIVKCLQASVVRSKEEGSFNKVAGMSIVTVGSPCSVEDTSTTDSQLAY